MRFEAGHTAWNKGIKGLQLSPATQFKKGRKSNRWLPVGNVTLRTDKAGRLRAWVKVADPATWKLRAVINWEAVHGPLPDGHLVHHRDRNGLNDEPGNLSALTRSEHVKEHARDLLISRGLGE